MIDAKPIRVFPRRTKATPDDERAFVGEPPLFRPPPAPVLVSCTFTWDMPQAVRLARSWARYYDDVQIGGPAFGDPGGDFEPGLFIRPGRTITSRGCPNRCACCFVPAREGRLRVLPIRPGWDILDNNLLACPPRHVDAVFDMLAAQPKPARFTGGLEAARITPAIAAALARLKIDVIQTAFDRPEQRDGVERAIGRLRSAAGWSDGTARRRLSCYVLVGFPGDTIAAAEARLEWILSLGARPFPMFYRDEAAPAKPPREWSAAIRPYLRPSIAFAAPAADTEPHLLEPTQCHP